MKSEPIFTGAACALVTPFCRGEVDYAALGTMIDYQIENKTDALVVCGTTGEAPTLSDEEHRSIIRYAVEHVSGRIPVIAGTGSNNTSHAVEMSRFACEAGADALLLVTPYYNRATPEGLEQSFLQIADSVTRPIILYNVPSRTSVAIPLSVYRRLAQHPNIAAVKEAGDCWNDTARLFAECGELLDIYAGNDSSVLPILSMGGKGVISVLSNILPRRMHSLCVDFRRKRLRRCRETAEALQPVIDAMFCEVNPIPVKTALSMMNLCSGELRLPLCPPSAEHAEQIRAALDACLDREAEEA